MLRADTRKRLEDRLYIKASQVLRRHLTPKELAKFFAGNKGNLRNLERQFDKELDLVILDYLEKIIENSSN